MGQCQLIYTLFVITIFSLGESYPDPNCPAPSDIAPCTCFREIVPPVGYNVYIYCEGTDTLDLKAMFHRLSSGPGFYRFRLTNTQISELPADMFGNVQFAEIEIRTHSLRRVHSRALSGPVGHALNSLYINDSPIGDADGDYDLFKALAPAVNLHELSLINTSLTAIPANALHSAPALHKVTITDNTRLTSLGSRALNLTSQLLSVNLRNNRIDNVSADAIRLVPTFAAELNVSGNPLSSRPMSADMFASIAKGNSVSLYTYGDGFQYVNRTVFEPYLSSSTQHRLYSDTDCADSRRAKPTMSTLPTVGYFARRGRAQSIRLLLKYANIKFTDKRYAYPKDWQSEKFTLGLDFPNIPYDIDGDLKLTQSMAIMRYLGEKHGLSVTADPQRAVQDMAEQQLQDVFEGLVAI
ncbi:unnamed protein product, partial [Medioppia subpectinata]